MHTNHQTDVGLYSVLNHDHAQRNTALKKTSSQIVGSDLLRLLTHGLNTDPLSIYREYIQNSVDSIVSLKNNQRTGKIEIFLTPSELSLSIRDNGAGLSYQQAVQQLIPIGKSKKQRGVDRGFRGIGRLSGLAFGESVSFLTRQHENFPVTRVRWDGTKLRSLNSHIKSIEEAVDECVSVDVLEDNEYPARFFQVDVEGIARFAAGTLLNQKLVRDYVGETCPVPFSQNFKYIGNVSTLFNKTESPKTFNIFINDEPSPVFRPFGEKLKISKSTIDSFAEFERVEIPSLEGTSNAAVGWVAHTSYLGALPKKLGIRGVHARDGNIQIGDETLFDHLFTENRFNRWCVAEIHILDPRIVPNGRRDNFEPGPHTRNLENHLRVLVRNIEKRCRSASTFRHKIRRIAKLKEDVTAICTMVNSGYLTENAAICLVEDKLAEISNFKLEWLSSGYEEREIEVLNHSEGNLFKVKRNGSRCKPIAGVVESEQAIYQTVFSKLVEVTESPSAAKTAIEGILFLG